MPEDPFIMCIAHTLHSNVSTEKVFKTSSHHLDENYIQQVKVRAAINNFKKSVS